MIISIVLKDLPISKLVGIGCSFCLAHSLLPDLKLEWLLAGCSGVLKNRQLIIVHALGSSNGPINIYSVSF